MSRGICVQQKISAETAAPSTTRRTKSQKNNSPLTPLPTAYRSSDTLYAVKRAKGIGAYLQVSATRKRSESRDSALAGLFIQSGFCSAKRRDEQVSRGRVEKERVRTSCEGRNADHSLTRRRSRTRALRGGVREVCCMCNPHACCFAIDATVFKRLARIQGSSSTARRACARHGGALSEQSSAHFWAGHRSSIHPRQVRPMNESSQGCGMR